MKKQGELKNEHALPKKQSRKEKIQDAAFAVFMEKGYQETRMIDIANQAGVAKGTVYEYFDSKETLFFELFHDRMISQEGEAENILEDSCSPKEKMKKFIDFEFRSRGYGNPHHRKGCLSVRDVIGMDLEKNAKLAEEHQRMMKQRLLLIEKIIREGVRAGDFAAEDVEITAISCFGAVSFLMSQYYKLLPDYGVGVNLDLDETKESLFRLLMRGLEGGR